MPDDRQTAPDTLEMYLDHSRLVEAGARILYRLREGCTPGDILDEIAAAADLDAEEYRGLVLGVLTDVDGTGDFKL